jgi:hypothetical protein
VLNALKAGTAALNKLHEDMSIEDVEKLLEETNEAIEVPSRSLSLTHSCPHSVLRLRMKSAHSLLGNSQLLMKVN